jgi:hypothetical protein
MPTEPIGRTPAQRLADARDAFVHAHKIRRGSELEELVREAVGFGFYAAPAARSGPRPWRRRPMPLCWRALLALVRVAAWVRRLTRPKKRRISSHRSEIVTRLSDQPWARPETAVEAIRAAGGA